MPLPGAVDRDPYDLAAPLFTLAGGYGRFDAMRIVDKTAGSGVSVLIMNVGDGLTPEQKRDFLLAVQRLHDDPKRHAWFCAQIAKTGPPQYSPVYLMAHGMGLKGNEQTDANGLDPDFDASKTWRSLVHEGMLCP